MKKKLLSIVLMFLVTLGLYAGSGDVNGDGKINAADIVELVNFLNGNPSGSFKQDAADVNEDGNIDSKDVDALSNVIMAGNEYIMVVSDKEVVLDNDHKEFDVIVKSDMDAYNIWVDIPNNDKMSLVAPSGREDIREGVYKWHFESWAEKGNYSGEDWKSTIYFVYNNEQKKDSIQVIYKSAEQPSFSVTPKEITVENKEHGRDFFIELTKSHEWLDVQVEYIGNEEDWIEWYIVENGRLHFGYKENYTGKDRVAQIIFKNEEYNLQESVTVTSKCGDWVDVLPDDLPERYVRAQKREYNLIGLQPDFASHRIEFGIVLRTGGISSSEEIGCMILDNGTEWLELGPITQGGCYFSYEPNKTGTEKTCRIVLYDKGVDIKEAYKDTINVNLLPTYFHDVNFATSANNLSNHNSIFIQPAGDEIDFILYGGVGQEVNVDMQPQQKDGVNYEPGSDGYVDYIHHVSTEAVGNDLHFRLRLDPNNTEEERWQVVSFPVRYTEGCQQLNIGQAPKSAPSAAQMRQALMDLYNATDGANWYRNEGWCSDKPLSQWDLLGLSGLGDYVYGLPLNGNSMVGTIPESFTTLMESRWDNNFYHNRLYGRIPDAVINHPKWSEIGWDVVVQDLWPERRLLEYDDLKLKLPSYEIDHVNGNLKTSDELFAKNKVNVVMIGLPSEEMANLHLSYHNKGYGTIVSAYDWLEGKREDSEVAAEEFPIKDIDFVWECPWAYDKLFGLTAMGTWYVFDDKSNLLACYVRDWDIPEEWYASKVDSICRKFLGEPEEHEPYSEYTSTDYSKDGEVKQLQQATVGKGIDIVFMGECFIDKEMGDGGEYDQQIAAAVDQFFDEEPYKSLRNRFNVYQVKAVAKKNTYGNKATYAIKEDDSKAFEYAKKAVGEDAKLMLVNVIYRNGGGASLDVNRSYCSMYADGSYVAYDLQGGRVINHEGGGHGIAQLLDEYVEGNMAGAAPTEEYKNSLDGQYAATGSGANIDWRSDPTQVRWRHFINDTRYANEQIGVYEGAVYGQGMYRPTENSMMRYNDCGFNAPSREAIYKRVMKLSEGDDWTYDYETFVQFDAPARAAFDNAANASRRAQARRAQRTTEQRSVTTRPPTFYKGTWRDAGKCEKIEYSTTK